MSGQPKLHCPRCRSAAEIVLGWDFVEPEKDVDKLGIVLELMFAAIATCRGRCGEPALDMPVDTQRHAMSGWVPPAPFDERSKAWYREVI